MKKITIFLVALCASLMVGCGNAAVDKINQLVVDATVQTKAATSGQEVVDIATHLQAEMDKIEAESGDKLAFGKSADAALAKYQEAVAAKLEELGIEIR